MDPLLFRALHLVFMVTWFAGLFFFSRILVYYAETVLLSDSEKKSLLPFLEKNAKRLNVIILWPSLIGVLLFGSGLMVITEAYRFGWMHFKLLMVVGLVVVHFLYLRIWKNLLANTKSYRPGFLRMMSELPSVFLVGIIFTVVFKNIVSGVWAILGLLVVASGMVISIRRSRR